ANMKQEFEILNQFIKRRGLRYTSQREKVLDIFLSKEGHISLEELYKLVREKYPDIGYTTVYRTMKLLCECGLCQDLDLGDDVSRYEHKYAHQHHDHLICIKCNKVIEVVKQQIEKLQDDLAKKHGFLPVKHKLQIFGVCKKCLNKGK
ncbi:MAG: Fur family transcriptional regulator, partial [Candidatus Omnitrophota bacterium]